MATAGGIRIGRAFVSIDAIDNTGRILRRAGANLQRFARSVQQFGQRQMLGGVLANMGTGIAVKQFTDLDDIMRRVQAKSTGTAAQMAVLRQQVKALAMDTGIAATQIGTLMEQLAQGGFNYAEIAKLTEPITRLSQAGGSGSLEDQAMAADAVTQAIRSFNLTADDGKMVAELLTVALNDSNFALEDLITSMSYVGPVAKAFGADIKSVIALTAILRNVNVNASVAGTAIRNMFLQMSSETRRSKFNEELKRMTGQTVTFVDASNNLRPLPEILKDIGVATAGLGTADKGQIFGELLGLRALVPGMMLSADMAGQLGNQFEKMMAGLDKHEGVLDKTADIINGGLGGALRKVWQSVIVLAETWGEQLAPMLSGSANYLRNLVAETINWVQANQKVVVIITAVAAIIPVAGLAIFGLGTALYFAASGMYVFGTLMMFGISLVAGLIGILATPIVVPTFLAALLLYLPIALMLLSTFSAELSTLAGTLSQAFGIDILMSAFGRFFGYASEGFNKIKEDATNWVPLFVQALSQGNIQAAMSVLTRGLEMLWMSLTDSVMSMLDEITFGIYAVYNAWKDTAVAIADYAPLGHGESMTNKIENEKNNSQATAINERRRHEIADLESLVSRTPEQDERLSILKAAGKIGTVSDQQYDEMTKGAYNREVDGWRPDANMDPAARRTSRAKAAEERRTQLEDELNAISLGLVIEADMAEQARLDQFTGEQAPGTPGAPALPGGVPMMAALSPEALEGRFAGSLAAFQEFTKNRAGGKTTEELLEEQNGKHDEEIALLGTIRDKLGDDGGEYLA